MQHDTEARKVQRLQEVIAVTAHAVSHTALVARAQLVFARARDPTEEHIQANVVSCLAPKLDRVRKDSATRSPKEHRHCYRRVCGTWVTSGPDDVTQRVRLMHDVASRLASPPPRATRLCCDMNRWTSCAFAIDGKNKRSLKLVVGKQTLLLLYEYGELHPFVKQD